MDSFDEQQHSTAQAPSDPETLLLQTDNVVLIERALRDEGTTMLPAALALAPVHIRLERVGRQLYRCARRQKPRPVEVAAENVELAGSAEQRGAFGQVAAERT
jgi:hypothetical protein